MYERSRFTRDIKEDAVKLLSSSSKTSLEFTNYLDIKRDILLRWKKII